MEAENMMALSFCHLSNKTYTTFIKFGGTFVVFLCETRIRDFYSYYTNTKYLMTNKYIP